MEFRISNPLKKELMNKIHVISNLLVSVLSFVTFENIAEVLDDLGGSGK